MRSLLFVPADSERKLARALESGADALILDLEDSVVEARKPAAREAAAEALRALSQRQGGPRLMVRVNSLDGPHFAADLAAFAGKPPEAVVLPKSTCGGDIQRLGVELAVLEAAAGAADGSIGAIAIATESGAALFGLGTYAGASARLRGLAWGAEDLSADLGARENRDPQGALLEPYRLVRSLVLFAAAAAGTAAIDGVFVRLRDESGLRAECAQARRDGFSGKLAIHPDQIAAINEAFTPRAEELARARRIVEAFAASPGEGALSLDGEMIDRPHLLRAERLLRGL